MKTKMLLLLAIILIACSKDETGSATNPNLSIEDVSVMEGNGGSGQVEIKLQLSAAALKDIVVSYATIANSAKEGEDFTAVENGSVTIAKGEMGKSIFVPVVADDIKEGNETFNVKISSATNANVIRSTSIVTLLNDDTRILISNAGYEAPTSYPGYTLVWKDEFNGNSLNTSDWTYETGDGCPNCGWGNNELQYYTNSSENLFFQDGKMIIEAKPQNVGGKQYSSARIKTEGKKAFKFGRIDFRAKLPKGKGIWPAFWMMPQNNTFGTWPRSGELDIMELIGNEPAKVYGTLHFGPGPGSTQISKNYTLPSGTFNDEFHVFSIEWKQDEIKWFVDGNLFSTAKRSDFNGNNYPFNEDFFFIINLAVGGNWPGNPDTFTTFPQWYIVDYIRVYQ